MRSIWYSGEEECFSTTINKDILDWSLQLKRNNSIKDESSLLLKLVSCNKPVVLAQYKLHMINTEENYINSNVHIVERFECRDTKIFDQINLPLNSAMIQDYDVKLKIYCEMRVLRELEDGLWQGPQIQLMPHPVSACFRHLRISACCLTN